MKEKIKKIVDEKTAIHITSMKQLEELRKIAIELDITPITQNKSHLINKGDFCVVFELNRMYWCERSWYIEHGYNVIEFEDLCKNECIVIYRKDNKVIALDKSTGEKAVAKCSPEDKFDFKTGAKLAFERLTGEDKTKIDDTIKVGDMVTVVDDGLQYPLHYKFFEENNIDYMTAVRFVYGENIDNGGTYRVVAIGKHKNGKTLCVIKSTLRDKCYLIDIEGVKKC